MTRQHNPKYDVFLYNVIKKLAEFFLFLSVQSIRMNWNINSVPSMVEIDSVHGFCF